MMLLFTQVQMENLAAYQAGSAFPHMVTGAILSYGSGSFPLIIAMLIFAKSKANRSITKLAAIPSFFGVDEPSYFGVPMILNPIFFLPCRNPGVKEEKKYESCIGRRLWKFRV